MKASVTDLWGPQGVEGRRLGSPQRANGRNGEARLAYATRDGHRSAYLLTLRSLSLSAATRRVSELVRTKMGWPL